MYRTITEDLKKWKSKKDKKPLILKGARQIGKTFLLKIFGENNFSNFHYFNFEEKTDLKDIFSRDLTPTYLISRLELSGQKKINIKNDLIIFDEIQVCPRAITSLKYFHEDMPTASIVCAGSLLGLELEEYSFPVGKVEFLNMYPMSFFEFVEAYKGKNYLMQVFSFSDELPDSMHRELWDILKIYFITGGLPEIVKTFIENHEDISIIREKQVTLINSYLADMAKHCGKQNAMHIERLWKNIPNQLSRDMDGSASKFKLRGQIPNVKGYERVAGVLDWLLKASLAIKVPIINHAEIPFLAYSEENRFKLFMFDVGLLGALSALPYTEILKYDYGRYKGYFAENFVAQEFNCVLKHAQDIFSWKENTAEVEFVKILDEKIVPIEVKSGWVTHSKSARIFQEKYNSPYRVVLSGKNFLHDKKNNIKYIPLYMASILKT